MDTTIRKMRRLGILFLVTFKLILGGTTRAADRSFTFASIDFPGAVLTVASGINPGGEVVGRYQDAMGKIHGFLLSNENFSSIDFPGAAATDARGIAPDGDIVGIATDPMGRGHGFLLSRGVFRTVDFPGHLHTWVQRITPTGKILGCYHDTDTMGTMFGILISGTDFSAISVPASMTNGATPDGSKIAGHYTDMMTGHNHGFLLEDGNFRPFDVPGSTLTQAWDINPAGKTVGLYRDSTGKFHGFLLADGHFASIDFPEALATRALGINPAEDIVGSYVDSSNRTHGFLLSKHK